MNFAIDNVDDFGHVWYSTLGKFHCVPVKYFMEFMAFRVTPDFCENTILRYELAMMARTCTVNLRVVLSP